MCERRDRPRRELDHARRAILRCVKEPFPGILHGYHRVETSKEAERWLSLVAQEVIAEADALDPEALRPRANCPLCHDGGSSFMGGDGSLIPEGLSRHLLG